MCHKRYIIVIMAWHFESVHLTTGSDISHKASIVRAKKKNIQTNYCEREFFFISSVRLLSIK